jgi:hypothetical protein
MIATESIVESSVHYISAVTVSPVRSTTGKEMGLYTLALQYAAGKEYHRCFSVYVPASILPQLKGGEVAEIHIDALSSESFAYRLLPERPSNLVTAIRLTNGSWHSEIPVRLRNAKLVSGAGALISLFLGGVLIHTACPWGGALLLVAGSHLAVMSSRVPTKPLQPGVP